MYIYYILPAVVHILQFCLSHPYYKRLKGLQNNYFIDKEFGYWQVGKAELLTLGETGYRIRIEDLGLPREQLDRLIISQKQSKEVVIADVDQDGFLASYYGVIKDVPTIPKERFLARKNFKVQVVANNGYVGIKKNYSGRKVYFINEIKALHNLRKFGCHVPAILDVDFDNLITTFSFIPGPVLREELAKQGAPILRDREVRNNPKYQSLSRKERAIIRLQEGRRLLHKVVDKQFIGKTFKELCKIHESKITGCDIKYGNVIIEKNTGNPYWIDFESHNYYTSFGKDSFRILRDQDINEFNKYFDSDELTYAEIKKRIEKNQISSIDDWKIPAHFGSGLYVGSLWDVAEGYGYWHCHLKHHLGSLSGKRILDLDANNAYYGLQMLRQSAQEVIGIEKDNKYISQGEFVKAAFEWADNTEYNFKYIESAVTEVPSLNLGEFDVVTALSSSGSFAHPDSMLKLVQYLSTNTNIFFLRYSKNLEIKSVSMQMSIKDIMEILKTNGFPIIKIVPSHGDDLIIASKN